VISVRVIGQAQATPRRAAKILISSRLNFISVIDRSHFFYPFEAEDSVIVTASVSGAALFYVIGILRFRQHKRFEAGAAGSTNRHKR